MNDFRNTIRINDSVINLDERLVICKSGPIKIRTQLRNILEELVLYSPDSVSIQDLTYYLEIKAKESIRRAIKELRTILGNQAILTVRNGYRLPNYSVISEDEFIKEFSRHKNEKQATKTITIKNADGTTETVDVINMFRIGSTNKNYIIMRKVVSQANGLEQDVSKAPMPLAKGMTVVYASEYIQTAPDTYKLIGIKEPDWPWVRQAMHKIILNDGIARKLTVQSIRYVDLISQQLKSIDQTFLQYPNIRKYFFAKGEKLPEDQETLNLILQVANQYGAIFRTIEPFFASIPTTYLTALSYMERRICLSDAVQLAMKKYPAEWAFFQSYIGIDQ